MTLQIFLWIAIIVVVLNGVFYWYCCYRHSVKAKKLIQEMEEFKVITIEKIMQLDTMRTRAVALMEVLEKEKAKCQTGD